MKYVQNPIVIEAYRWFVNGDHPLDYTKEIYESPEKTYSVAYRMQNHWEGDVVRYFRDPAIPGDDPCHYCNRLMHVHGWIDGPDGGHRVCPGDWVITAIDGSFYPCKPDLFYKLYSPFKEEDTSNA